MEANQELERFLSEHGAALRRAVVRFCPHNRGISFDDIEQDARLRIWKTLQRERKIENPASFISRVAMTATVDAIRRQKTRREDKGGLTEELELAQQQSPEPRRSSSPEDLAHRREVRARIDRALARLQPRRGAAVRLHIQGFSNQEVADLKGWSEPKARNLIYRGLKDLQVELRREGITFEI